MKKTNIVMTEKVVFITGSAKRIGAHTARYLHNLNYKLVLHCNHSVDEAQALMMELNSKRENSARLIMGDLCDFQTLQELADSAWQAFGRLDVLINNASSFYPTAVGQITLEHWQNLMGSNVQAPLFLSQYLAPQLALHKGVIINMVDIHAQRPLKEHTVYSMAKAALVTMTQSLAQELAPDIRVNAVAPGAILWPEQALDQQNKDLVLQQIPAQRLGSPQDIAQAIGYLIDAQYVNGQILAVDGGRSIVSSSKV
ncbi:MAG: pteridine reductase [Paraglaciecola sp.]